MAAQKEVQPGPCSRVSPVLRLLQPRRSAGRWRHRKWGGAGDVMSQSCDGPRAQVYELLGFQGTANPTQVQLTIQKDNWSICRGTINIFLGTLHAWQSNQGSLRKEILFVNIFVKIRSEVRKISLMLLVYWWSENYWLYCKRNFAHGASSGT